EDIVLGSRYTKGGDVIGWSRRRKAISFMANRFSRFSLGAAERDVTTGFRAYSREMAELILRESISDGYSFQVEAVHLAKRHHMSISEVPITFRERLWGDSKLSSRREAGHLLRMLVTRTPLRLFLLVALIASLVNELILLGLVGILNIHYLFAGLLAVEGGILTSFLLREKWTFRGREAKGWSLRLARYNAAVFVGLLLNIFVLFALTEFADLLYLTSNVFGIGTALSLNYRLGSILARRF
ncbi:MAG: GtrA family protein, partial [Candidatus Thermoplasmatota archaeon]|nr:GtrA family protein [Candidatus Thermoplasmatota archaeon]